MSEVSNQEPAKARRIVLKLGTGILTSEKAFIHTDRINAICREIAALRDAGIQTTIVSSGAVGLGMGRLELDDRPTLLPELQKCAAVGQSILTETWQKEFRPYDINVAQVLLTGSDMLQPDHKKVFGSFLEEVLSSNIVPIINENDSVSTAGFRLGDNDSLAALLACRIKADVLIILSTVKGLMNLDSGKIIRQVSKITPEIEALAQDTNNPKAVGGMLTKIRAARLANSSGCTVFIGSGDNPEIIKDIIDYSAEGTYFLADNTSTKSRKRLNHNKWKIHFAKTKGTLTVDDGARTAISENGSSILATGIKKCKGSFAEGDTLDILSTDGVLIARGVSSFNSEDVLKIAGKKSDVIREIFPDHKKAEVIHRDSLIVFE